MGTIIGIIIGAWLLFFAIIQGGWTGIFYDPLSLMIVGGGTFAAALISFTLNRVLSVFSCIKDRFPWRDRRPRGLHIRHRSLDSQGAQRIDPGS